MRKAILNDFEIPVIHQAILRKEIPIIHDGVPGTSKKVRYEGNLWLGEFDSLSIKNYSEEIDFRFFSEKFKCSLMFKKKNIELLRINLGMLEDTVCVIFDQETIDSVYCPNYFESSHFNLRNYFLGAGGFYSNDYFSIALIYHHDYDSRILLFMPHGIFYLLEISKTKYSLTTDNFFITKKRHILLERLESIIFTQFDLHVIDNKILQFAWPSNLFETGYPETFNYYSKNITF